LISIKLEGRLGNQLFQFAFIYAASKKLDTSFYLDKSIVDFILPEYFVVKNDFLLALDNHIFSIKGYKYIFSIHLKKTFYLMLEKICFGKKKIIVNSDASASVALMNLRNGFMYKGYFQSEEYFKNFKEDLKTIFTIKQQYKTAFNNISATVSSSKKTVTVHIRRGDYVSTEYELPTNYYKTALSMISDEDNFYVFVSDDPLFIEQEFKYIENKYISYNSEIIDLQFLINADICILSNSSFSWWGAWLNNKPGKKVIAPEFWLGQRMGQEYPPEIIPPEWTTIAC